MRRHRTGHFLPLWPPLPLASRRRGLNNHAGGGEVAATPRAQQKRPFTPHLLNWAGSQAAWGQAPLEPAASTLHLCPQPPAHHCPYLQMELKAPMALSSGVCRQCLARGTWHPLPSAHTAGTQQGQGAQASPFTMLEKVVEWRDRKTPSCLSKLHTASSTPQDRRPGGRSGAGRGGQARREVTPWPPCLTKALGASVPISTRPPPPLTRWRGASVSQATPSPSAPSPADTTCCSCPQGPGTHLFLLGGRGVVCVLPPTPRPSLA